MPYDIDENIMELIIKPPIEIEEPPMYVSKFRNSVKRAFIRGKSAHKTLGVPRVSLNSPQEFLRKHSRNEIKHSDIKHKHYHIPNYQHKLPEWKPQKLTNPSDKIPRNTVNSGKNFKQDNIVKVKNAQAKKPILYYVDDRLGNSFPRKPNGNFSVNPNMENENPLYYLEKNRQNEKTRKKLLEKFMKSNKNSTDQSSAKCETSLEHDGLESTENDKKLSKKKHTKREQSCRYVTEEERAQLLLGMKKRWEDMMKQFQSLPFLTDTPPKAKRKAKMEQDLKQLEKDIDMIERYPHIYVYNDNDD
ncbi:GSCOCG00000977001-RA-CDS [Cotesia congregata]|uniref:Similar to Enkur: Enkurin (Mus musculus) n=1 Tax=Cotesia congregata TaxID=51543 RepID=A0A8J2HEK6_COTCN|nr:GSCOCG00000977001-RA-CDS [Cotesia congregata]CAG5095890.1 Similar to Enkur: Enkurin (Mus musculus) [Cotesia congregata]